MMLLSFPLEINHGKQRSKLPWSKAERCSMLNDDTGTDGDTRAWSRLDTKTRESISSLIIFDINCHRAHLRGEACARAIDMFDGPAMQRFVIIAGLGKS